MKGNIRGLKSSEFHPSNDYYFSVWREELYPSNQFSVA